MQLGIVDIVLDDLIHADAHMDERGGDQRQRQDRNEGVREHRRHLGPFGARERNHQPDQKAHENDVDRARDALADERAGSLFARMGLHRSLLPQNQTNSAQTTTVAAAEKTSVATVMISRPAGSNPAPVSQTKCLMPPAMCWNSVQV